VDVRNVLAGTGNKEFKITVTRTAASPTETAVNAVVINVPAAFTLREGRATGWTAITLSPRAVFFTGGTIPTTCSTSQGLPTTTCSGTFSIFADVPTPGQDVTSRWSAGASKDGGDTYTEVPPDGSGAMDTVTRVLQATNLAITAPAGAIDNSVTATQNNVDAVCAIQNIGSADLTVTAALEGAQSTSPNPKTIAKGATESFSFRFNSFDDVNKNTTQSKACSGAATNASTDGFGKSVSVTINPRGTFEYVEESLSPAATAPLATPNFLIQVNKRQALAPPTSPATADASPAVTLDPAQTDFTILSDKGNIGPTSLGTATNVNAGEQKAVNLQFASLTIPATCSATLTTNCVEDKNYNIKINLGGTDVNGFALSFRPLPGTNDLLRIDAAIPILNNHTLTAPASRCCNSQPGVKNGDALKISANVTDRDPTGISMPCGACEVVKSELVQFDREDGGLEVGQRIPVTLTMNTDTGTLTGTYNGNYAPSAKSVVHHLIVKDTAGNRSDAGTGTPDATLLVPVDNIAPFIEFAATSPAPSTQGQDLQQTLTLRFSEAVDNFDQAIDSICPHTDWRTDNNTVLGCLRAGPPEDPFRGATLTVANKLPDDTPGTTLQYFPQTPLSFHDRVGNAIPAGSTVPILDKIPPKAPSFSTVAGKAADAGDGKYYTSSSNPPFVLTGARAVMPTYTVQLWRETGLASGLQVDGANADLKIGQSVVQQGQTSVTVTPDAATPLTSDSNDQDGVEHTVYARSLDNASPANGTDLNTVKTALVVVDIKAPGVLAARATVNGIEVDFGGRSADGTQIFNEAVIGRNSANSWEVLDTAGERYVVGSVEGSGSARTVKMADARYCPNAGCAVRPASIEYLFFGQASDRYQDRAGNVVVDKKVNVVI
jgi:hypothetical protein